MMNTSLTLIFGLFIGLVASQSLMDLFLSLSTLWGLWLVFKNRHDLGQLWPKWLSLSFVWFAWTLSGFLFKTEGLVSPLGVLGDFLWILQLPLLALLWKDANPKEKIPAVFIGVTLIGALYAVGIYIIDFDPLQPDLPLIPELNVRIWRTGGLFGHSMALAHSYGPLFVISMVLTAAAVYARAKNKIILILTSALLALTLLFTFSRGVWLGVTLALIGCGFIFNRRLGSFVLVMALLGGGTLFAGWPKFRERVIQILYSDQNYDSERFVIWNANLYMFKESPIFGIGYGENKRRLREYYDLLGVPPGQFEGHAHNQYLQVLTGTGFLGLLFYLIWCGLFLKLNWKCFLNAKEDNNHKMTWLLLGILGAQISFHIGGLTEANFTIAKNRMMLVFIWSFLLYVASLKNRSIR